MPQRKSKNSTEKRSVDLLLGLGILIIPSLFSWFTLRNGYSRLAKIVAFSWLLVMLLFIKMQVDKNVKKVQPAVEVQSTVAPKVISKQTNTEMEFPLTLDELLVRYRYYLGALLNGSRLKKTSGVFDDAHLVYVLRSNLPVVLGVKANSDSRYVESLVFIGIEDGSVQSNVSIMYAVAAAMMVFEGPEISIAQRGKIINELGIGEGKLASSGKIIINRDGFKYIVSKLHSKWIMFSAQRTRNKQVLHSFKRIMNTLTSGR